MLGTRYFLKIKKNQSVLLAKTSTRENFVPHDTSRRAQGVFYIIGQKTWRGRKKTKRLQYYNLLSSFDREQNFAAYHVAFIRRGLLILVVLR